MTTPPVVSITDELIEELEGEIRIARAINNRAPIHPGDLESLLAERADLKQQLAAASVDAERWRCARDLLHPDDIRDFQLSRVSFGMKPTEDISRQCDDAIDAVRNIGSN